MKYSEYTCRECEHFKCRFTEAVFANQSILKDIPEVKINSNFKDMDSYNEIPYDLVTILTLALPRVCLDFKPKKGLFCEKCGQKLDKK